MRTSRPKADSYRSRFGLAHHPLPRDASGASFFDQTASYRRLEMYFQELLDEPGLGLLTADPGVGKTASLRNLCAKLPEPDFKVVYLCDTAVTASDLYRTLALELGLKPSHRRAQLWWDLKRAIVHLVDEQHTLPLVVLDESQHLCDSFLIDLCGFLNFAFDRRTLLSVWLVGLPSLTRRLGMQLHAPLASRLAARVHLEPLEHDDFVALVGHGLAAAGNKNKLLTDSALELLWRASRGVARAASRLLRAALRQAHDRNQNLVDDRALTAAIDELTQPRETPP
jgi:MSHA biogenesis protein MshM